MIRDAKVISMSTKMIYIKISGYDCTVFLLSLRLPRIHAKFEDLQNILIWSVECSNSI